MEPIPVYDEAFKERMKNCQNLCSKKLSVSLNKHFRARLNGNQKGMSTDDCRRIVKKLHPAFQSMMDTELSRYGQVLRYYVKAWPHFDELIGLYITMTTGKDEFANSWYKEFCTYLILKMEDTWKMMTEFKNEVNSNLVDKSTQAGSNIGKTVADFCVVIEGPASLVYNGVFNLDGDDVFLEQHYTTPCSEDYYPLNINGFLNLPFISIRGSFADITFERRNAHEIERFLTKEHVIQSKKKYAVAVHMERVDEEKPVNVYTKNLTTLYLRQFLNLLRTIPEINNIKKLECENLVLQILKDIKEHLDNIPSNVKITYNIGNNIYLRKKQTEMSDLQFYEIITPKVALTLHGFSPIQDLQDKTRVSFESLNFFEKNHQEFVEHMNLDRFVFSCTLCSKDFQSLFMLHSHFKLEHREEHEVLCGGCKELIKMADLVRSRWWHNCKDIVIN